MPFTDAQIELCAYAAHEAMGGYGRALGHNNVTLWVDSPDWQKETARDFARIVASGRHLHFQGLSLVEDTKRRIAAAVVELVLAAIEETEA